MTLLLLTLMRGRLLEVRTLGALRTLPMAESTSVPMVVRESRAVEAVVEAVKVESRWTSVLLLGCLERAEERPSRLASSVVVVAVVPVAVVVSVADEPVGANMGCEVGAVRGRSDGWRLCWTDEGVGAVVMGMGGLPARV